MIYKYQGSLSPIRFLYYKIGIIIPFSGHNKVIPQNKSARYNVIEVNDYAD